MAFVFYIQLNAFVLSFLSSINAVTFGLRNHPKYKTNFPLSLEPQSCQTAVSSCTYFSNMYFSNSENSALYISVFGGYECPCNPI